MSDFEPVHTVIKEVSQHHVLGFKLLEARLQQEWEGLVGTTMAKHSLPENIRHKKLCIIADNSIWLQQLVFLKPRILEAIRALIPQLDITAITLRLGTVPPKPSIPDPEMPSSQPAPVLPSPFATDLAKQFRDTDLQALFSRTITRATTGSSTQKPPEL